MSRRDHTSPIECRRCRRSDGRRRRGLCGACYWHALTHGYLEQYRHVRLRVHRQDVRELRAQGWSGVAIAAWLGVSPQAVRTAEYRARHTNEEGRLHG